MSKKDDRIAELESALNVLIDNGIELQKTIAELNAQLLLRVLPKPSDVPWPLPEWPYWSVRPAYATYTTGNTGGMLLR